jgi:hypothetical protein
LLLNIWDCLTSSGLCWLRNVLLTGLFHCGCPADSKRPSFLHRDRGSSLDDEYHAYSDVKRTNPWSTMRRDDNSLAYQLQVTLVLTWMAGSSVWMPCIGMMIVGLDQNSYRWITLFGNLRMVCPACGESIQRWHGLTSEWFWRMMAGC